MKKEKKIRNPRKWGNKKMTRQVEGRGIGIGIGVMKVALIGMGAVVYRKKKSGAKEEASKVYECRFCSLKFCKSQALGGHMNRHRQERETETLNKARHLVFTNDLAPTAHLGYVSAGNGGTYSNMGGGEAPTPLRPVYPTRLFPPPPAAQGPYMYASPPRMLSFHSPGDYFLGHVLSGPGDGSNSYTCIGAPVGQSFAGGARDASMQQEEEGLGWGRT